VYKRVLVPLDGSELAETVLRFIVEIAGPLDMTIVLLRVVEPAPPVSVDSMHTISVDDIASRRRDAAEYLAPIAVGLRARGIETTSIVRVGSVDQEILAAARGTNVDLIAMSTHGRTGFGRLLFGSVAEQVLRHADVPVFMMRHTERRTTVPPMTEAKR
jgi:nucleotide-binding universal stress UspA family protein